MRSDYCLKFPRCQAQRKAVKSIVLTQKLRTKNKLTSFLSNIIFKSKMLLRWLGSRQRGVCEARHNGVAQRQGNDLFYCAPLGEALPYLHTVWEADNDAIKIRFDLN